MRVLLSGTIRFLLEAGPGPDDLEGELHRLLQQVKSGRPLRRLKSRSACLIQAGTRLLFEWHWEAQYVDSKTGCPRPLALEEDRGPNLTALLVRHFPRLSVQSALAWMEEHRGIARQLDGRYLPLRRCFIIGDSPELAAEAVVGVASDYLEAGLHSVLTSDSSGRGMDRMISVSRLPVKNVGLFCRLAERQLHSQMDGLHEWLDCHQVQDADEPCVPVGVHCFVYIGNTCPASGSRRRSQK
jgi:hypothetical protein